MSTTPEITDASVQRQVDALFTTRQWPRIDAQRGVREIAVPLLALQLSVIMGAVLAVRWTSAGSWVSDLWFILYVAAICSCAAATRVLARCPSWFTATIGSVSIVVGYLVARGSAFPWSWLPLVTGAMLLGFTASRWMFRLVWILPVAILASLNDIRSVNAGFTETLLGDQVAAGDTTPIAPASVTDAFGAPASTWTDVLLLPLPAPGGSWQLGMVDVAFASLLVAATAAYGLGVWRTVGGMVIAAAVVVVSPVALPMVPLLLVGMLLSHGTVIVGAAWHEITRVLYPARRRRPSR